jgi:hypothetical protein
MSSVPQKLRLAAITLIAIAALTIAQLQLVDNIGRDYTESTLKRALVTFGIARGLNGVISVAQGTQVAIEPAGIGLNFAPGQILQPVNDLIERFSWVMLAASTSLGIQRVSIEMISSRGYMLTVASFVALSLLLAWLGAYSPAGLRRIVSKLAIALLLIRFAIPVMAICSEDLYAAFLSSQYEKSTQQLEATTTSIAQINRNTAQEVQKSDSNSLLQGARRLYESAAASFDIQGRIEQYKQSASDATEHAVDLIVVFVLQTAIFPLLFLWCVLALLKTIARH